MIKKRVFKFKGKTLDELKEMSVEELSKLFNARIRRSLKRGFTKEQKILLEKVNKGGEKLIKTHARNMVILPKMVGLLFGVHNGKEFVKLKIKPAMIGHFLGEFVLTRKEVDHTTPGPGSKSPKVIRLE